MKEYAKEWLQTFDEIDKFAPQNISYDLTNTAHYALLSFIVYMKKGDTSARGIKKAISFTNAATHYTKIQDEPKSLKRLSHILNYSKFVCVSFIDIALRADNCFLIAKLPLQNNLERYLYDTPITNMVELKAYVWIVRFAYRLGWITLATPYDEV